MTSGDIATFWEWFFRGVSGRPGLTRVTDRWFFFHLCVGAALGWFIDAQPAELAKSALLPLMAILVGLTFSWAGNVNAILQTDEVIKFVREKGGPQEYVYTFQLCILINIAVIGAWCIPLLELPYVLHCFPYATFERLATALLMAAVSLAIRTGWHAVIGSNMLLLRRLKDAPTPPGPAN